MMAKKLFPKALSVGLSLTLCAAMVMPSFAAVALNKAEHIDSNGALLQNSEGNYDYYLDQDIELDKTLIIGKDVTASIDLKGHDLVHTGATGSVISIKGGGKLELDDTTAETDEEGNYTAGKITGGKGTRDNIGTTSPGVMGGGIHVAKDGELDLNGGTIAGNSADWGGGIGSNGTVVMSGGQISENTSNEGGGVFNAGQFTMVDGEISQNVSNGDGGGVYNSGDFVMEDGKINENVSKFDGGGMYMTGYWNVNSTSAQASFTMNGGEMADNKAVSDVHWAGGGGVAFENSSSFTMNGGAIVRNEAQGNTEENTGPNGIEGSNAVINYGNVLICNYGKDGVETVHEFGDKATDIGESGHQVHCLHCDKPSETEAHSYGPWETVTPAQVGVEGERKHICTVCGHEETEPIPALSAPITSDPGVTIDDVDVPLAGLFTRADAIGYLWEQEGSPDWELSEFPDVPEDHEWAVAIGWAEDMGIALPDLEGNFRPDEPVLTYVDNHELYPEGELEEFLNRFAEYAGIELDEDELFFLVGGEAYDIVMGEDAQVIFDEFFAKLEAALAQAA